jgi:ubiquinone/menaquinone biosynthesis C-methylase UbiE
MAVASYVCPDCKAPLERFYCLRCRFQFPCVDGVPRLLSRDPRFERTETIAGAYDSIYAVQSKVWENQGRTPEFIRFFSSFLDRFPGTRSLEIGCGEGFLLASRKNGEKFAVDLSIEAIRQARARATADFSLALAERLPFPADYFDLVTSVGVMEHFLDIGEALREIRRILKPGGHYVSLTHVDMAVSERIAAKLSEFIFPRPRPIRFARWLKNKLTNTFPKQPIQNRYTTDGAKAWLAESGFNVLDILHRRKHPDLPLIAPWVVIYVAQK